MRRRTARILGVGAALLVPVGGLMVLGVGTVGASLTTMPPTLSVLSTSGTHAYSFVKLGTVGRIYLGGASGSLTTTSGRYVGTYTDTATSTKPHLTVVISAHITVSHTGSTVGKVKFTAGATGKLSGTTLTHCEIATLPAIFFTKTGSVWKTTGNSLTTARIVSYGTGTCNGITILENDLSAARAAGTIKVS
jgi:hypothetical protein